jgi:hypothetical protein
LPDRVYFQTKEPYIIGYILECLEIDNVGKFCGHSEYFMYNHLVCFMASWHILWSFNKFFPHFGKLYAPRKIWQPCGQVFFPNREIPLNLVAPISTARPRHAHLHLCLVFFSCSKVSGSIRTCRRQSGLSLPRVTRRLASRSNTARPA